MVGSGAWENGPVEEDKPASRPWWRRGAILWALIPAVLFVALISIATTKKLGPPGPGDKAPEFSAPILDGDGTFGTANLVGTPYVLNFWASWCAPCVDEAPMLKQANDRFGDQVEFVGVDIRDARGDALKFVREHGLAYPHVRDEELELYRDFGLTGQPETFFVDANGVILEHVNGPLSEDVLSELVGELLQ
jgi:cytochrome c biogenesis protein CcmG/thiol:disulfide interchange protein DsbE